MAMKPKIDIEAVRRWPYKLRMRLREVHVVVEWRDSTVFRTRSLGYIACPPNYRPAGAMVGPLSTSVTKALEGVGQ